MSNWLRPGSIVLDLGMNRGTFARALSHRWQCSVFGLEPVPELAHDLREEGLHVLDKALTGEDGPVALHRSRNVLASSVVDGFVDDSAPVTTVDGISLATLMSELDVDRAELAKLDVEGAEFDVFETAADDTLLRIRQFTVEFHDFIDPIRFKDRVDRISERMEALGFTRIKFTLSNFDVVYLHPELVLRRSDRVALTGQKYFLGVSRRLMHRRDEETEWSPGERLRTLEIGASVGMGWPPVEELRRMIAGDRMSNVLALHDALGITALDGPYLTAIPGTWGRLLRRLPFRVAQAIELVRRRNAVDAVFTWGERDAIGVGALMLFVPRRPAHVAILFWPAKWKKALPLRLVQRGVDRMIVPSPLQRRLALERFGLPRGKVVDIPWSVDTRFFRPMPCPGREDMICAVGLEMRDYATLLAALRPLDIRCHIAVGAGAASSTPKDALAGMPLREGITVGRKGAVELRELYACSRFVVVPLQPSNSDNGITTCLEAMAMGRAVICTETAGQVGVLVDGVNSLRVPPHDEVALRRAIVRLWNDEELRARLGTEGRTLVEERYDNVEVAQRVRAVFREAVQERRSGLGGRVATHARTRP